MNEEDSPLATLSDAQLHAIIKSLSLMFPAPLISNDRILADPQSIMRLQFAAGQHSVVTTLIEHQRHRKEAANG
jgi:hypothetical protein